MLPHYDVLIVGAGHGGVQAATALRHEGFAGSIGLIGDDPEQPYERPPLSKDYLAGDTPFERLVFHPAELWDERKIDVLLGTRIASLDPDEHVVCSADGSSISYGQLVWAAGGSPRRLSCPGSDLSGVHTLRTREDSDRIRAEVAEAREIVVVGGGYIGLETAAVLTRAGKHVTVVEALDRVLARVAGERLSRFYEAEHRAHGVDLRLGAAVARLEGHGQVASVILEDGERLPADLVIAGIGIVPNVAPLLLAGAEGGAGVLVDARCRTTLPDVFSIGDCAAHVNRYAGAAPVRIESVQNAVDQASVVARVLTGQEAAYDAVPWFWSKQYDLRLQTVGISSGHDESVVRGDPTSRRFSVVYLQNGRVVALDCVNAVKDYAQGRRLVANGVRATATELADTGVALKDL